MVDETRLIMLRKRYRAIFRSSVSELERSDSVPAGDTEQSGLPGSFRSYPFFNNRLILYGHRGANQCPQENWAEKVLTYK